MKVEIEITMEPEEARRLLGLPDLESLQEAYVSQLERMVKQSVTPNTAQDLVKNWTSLGESGLGMLSSLFGKSAYDVLKTAKAQAMRPATPTPPRPSARETTASPTSTSVSAADSSKAPASPRVSKPAPKPRAKSSVASGDSSGAGAPKAGSAAATIWKICDRLRATGSGATPTRKAVLAAAERQGTSSRYAAKEYYQWKKFHNL